MTDKQTKQAMKKLSEDDLASLLGEIDFLEVPTGFTSKVMVGVDELPVYESDQAGNVESNSDVAKSNPAQQPPWWQWAALIGGGIPALMQVLAFIFSAWNIASLG